MTIEARIERVYVREFTETPSAGLSKPRLMHLERLHEPYGRTGDVSVLGDGRRIHTFATMLDTAIAELGFTGPGGPEAGLVVVAHDGMDCSDSPLSCARVAATTAGSPHVLVTAEQGAATPFTVLRIAANAVRAGECERALVLLVEQSAGPIEERVALPARDLVVALVVGTAHGQPIEDLTTVVVPRVARAAPTAGVGASRWASLTTDHELTVDEPRLGYRCTLRLGPAPSSRVSAGRLSADRISASRAEPEGVRRVRRPPR